jgi:anaerobic selenocysteine-containing dehydrogenase
MDVTRREFLKTSAATATATAAGITIPAAALAKSKEAEAGVQWDKGVCRFCGTGCGIMVGTKDGRIVATSAVGQGRMPLLRHRLRHHGRHKGRPHRRHQG